MWKALESGMMSVGISFVLEGCGLRPYILMKPSETESTLIPRFAANLTMLFSEVDFLDRFEAAAGTGFSSLEYLFPYDYDAEQVAELLSKNGLTQVLHSLPAGDWDGGDRGMACDPWKPVRARGDYAYLQESVRVDGKSHRRLG